MDGMDFTTIDEIDQGMFDVWPVDSDDESDSLLHPDIIGIDSALQDCEKLRLESLSKQTSANKSREERELEVRLLAPDSIRREILERSIKTKRALEPSEASTSRDTSGLQRASHLMNIIEKAGMSGIDRDRVNRIIHDASRGSLFFKKQGERQATVHKSINKMLARIEAATPTQLANGKALCDKMIQEVESKRIFNRVIAHFDLDMFFAAVEIRDRPSLENKPVAVGGDSMLSTSNYIARQYGVRAAMPGFIARKLCPELVIIRPDGAKYRQASSQVFTVLEQYDPEFSNIGLDEAYLDLTDYTKSSLEADGISTQDNYDGTLPKIWWTRASQIVEEIRVSVYGRTKLTCSAGIACNTMLAKIATDVNKPDGQFMIPGYPDDVMEFIKDTPIGKVSGIGKVSVQFLEALEIRTCADIVAKRELLPVVFQDVNLRFYLRAALGDGSVSTRSDDQRKSKSVERTFPPIKDTLLLLEKLESICEELCTKYLRPYKIKGRTVTVKIKRNTFTTTTKSYSLLVPTGDKVVIYSTAKNLLLVAVSDEPAEISYRLLGVKLSNLADDGVVSNQPTIHDMLQNYQLSRPAQSGPTTQQQVEAAHQDVAQDLPDEMPPSVRCESSSSSSNEPTTPRPTPATQTNAKKRSSPSDQRIDSFFQKIPRKSPPEQGTSTSSSMPDGHEATIESAAAPEQSVAPQLEEEELPCPFCLKMFAPFSVLQSHAETCRFRTSIDANKLFFSSQRTLAAHSPSSSSASTTTNVASRTPKRKHQEGIMSYLSSQKRKREPSTSPRSLQTNLSSPKLPYYQQFLESNSKNFDQAKNTEAYICAHCSHGFLQLTLLEAHMKTCAKRRLD